jgi:hypothetical protein
MLVLLSIGTVIGMRIAKPLEEFVWSIVLLRTVRERDGQIATRLLVRELCLGKCVAVAGRVDFLKVFVTH